jgi:CRP/FNR family transcriptional regulator
MNLEKFPFYTELDENAKEFLQKHLKPVTAPKDTILFFQGDICDAILFLTSGEVRLYIQSDAADEITLYHLNPAEQCIVNTASTLSETEAIASAVTLTDITGYMLDRQSVKELAHMSDAYQSFLFSIYTLRMGDLAQLINDIKFKKLDQRVMEWLKAKNQKSIKTTHESIANELGSTREVISKVLKRLEKRGDIQLSRGTVTLM